ncbi:MAG: flippase [Anaerolineae bacterium]
MTNTHSFFRRVSLNSVWLLLARVGSQGLMLLFTVLVARRLGEAGLGQYAFIAAVLFVGNVFTTFGMDTILIREIANRGQVKSAPMAQALQLQLSLSVIFILAVWLVGSRLPNQTAVSTRALTLTMFSLLPLALTTVFSAALRAFERMSLVLLVNLTTAVLQTGGVFVLFGQGGGLVGLAWVLVGSQVGTAVLAALLCVRLLPHFSITWSCLSPVGMWETAVIGLPLALLMVLAVIYQRTGIFILSLLQGDAATGYFSAAMRLIEAAKIVPYAIFGALFPIMVRQHHTRQVRAPLYGFFVSLGYVLVAAIGLNVLADWLIPALFGNAYTPSVEVLRILAWSLLPFAATLTVSFQLVAQHQERLVLVITFRTLVITAVLTFIGTRTAGLIGTAWAIVAGETLQAILLFIGFMQRYRTPKI